MLRAAMFWPVGSNPSNDALRTASAVWNGRPVTCMLLSGRTPSSAPGRTWEETEYCVDNASGLLQIFSRAPGTYVVYSYSGNLQFHGRQVPDQLAIFVNGEAVLNGQVTIKDADPSEASLTMPDASMSASGMNAYSVRFPMFAGSVPNSGINKSVIVNATIDTQGKVAEAEISAASDPSLASAALDFVRKAEFGQSTSWRQAYINVKFPQ